MTLSVPLEAPQVSMIRQQAEALEVDPSELIDSE